MKIHLKLYQDGRIEVTKTQGRKQKSTAISGDVPIAHVVYEAQTLHKDGLSRLPSSKDLMDIIAIDALSTSTDSKSVLADLFWKFFEAGLKRHKALPQE